MNRCHWATWALLAALAGLFTGCAEDGSKEEADAGLKVVLRLTSLSVQTSVNDSAEVNGTAFLLTTGNDFVPFTHLHLSTNSATGRILFPNGSLRDTTDASGGIDFVYVVYGREGPGVQRLKASAGGITTEQELRVDVYDWYVASLELTAADTIFVRYDYPTSISVLATVHDEQGEPMFDIPVYYQCDRSWSYEPFAATDTQGHAYLDVSRSGSGNYCFTAIAGRQQDTLCVVVVITYPDPYDP